MVRPLFIKRPGTPEHKFPVPDTFVPDPPFFKLDWSMPYRNLPVDTGEMVGSETKVQEAPFRQSAVWGMPVRAGQIVPALIVANLLLTTLAVSPRPVQGATTDVPKRVQTVPGFQPPNLLASTLAVPPVVTLPFGKTDWSMPYKAPLAETNEHYARPVDVNTPNPQASGTSFFPLAFPLPTRSFYQPPFQPPNLELFQLVAPAAKPFSPVFFPMPPRQTIDTGEHYARPVDVTAPNPPASGVPFLPVSWGMPYRNVEPRRTIIYRLPEEATATLPFSPVFWSMPYRHPQPRKTIMFRGDAPAEAAAPFGPLAWPMPNFKRADPDFRPRNLLLSTLSLPPNEKPFLKNDWSRPYEIRDHEYLKLDWVQNILISTLALPPVIPPVVVEEGPFPVGHPGPGVYYKKKLIKVPLTERQRLEVALGERVEELYDEVTKPTAPAGIKEKAAEIVKPAVERKTQEVDLVKAAKNKELVAKLEALQQELETLEDDAEILLAVQKMDEEFLKAIMESLKNALI